MPKLPAPESIGLREAQPVTSIASYDPKATDPSAPGVALAQTAEKTGNAIEALLKIEQEKQDTTKVEDAWNKYKTQALDMTNGEQGVLKLKGGDAVNSNMLQGVTEKLKAQREALEAGLGSDIQRTRFRQRADATDLNVQTQVLAHLATEQDNYAKIVMQGNESVAKTTIGADPANGQVFLEAKDVLLRQADAYLNRNGIKDAGARDAYKNQLTDSLWTKRYDGLLYSQPQLADALFRANQGEIKNPELRLQLQQKTREVGLAVTATQDAAKFIQETRTAPPAFYARQADGKPIENPQAALVEINNALKKRPGDEDLIQAKYAIENGITEPNTSGLPNSRDVAAQLPMALARVDKAATDRYGPDAGNPDRVAYIARTKAAITAQIQQDVVQLNAIQEQSAGVLLDAIGGVTPQGPAGGIVAAGGQGGGGGGRMKMTSFAQIQANPSLMAAYQKLDYKQKLVVQNALDSNLKKDEVGDPALYNELRNRISLPPNDPNKISWWQGVTQDPRVAAGKLNIAQLNSLRSTLNDDATDDGRSQLAVKKGGEQLVRSMFQGDLVLTDAGTNKAKADYAQALWAANADKVVGLYKQQNKDIRPLFDPDPSNKESLVTPAALAQFKVMAGSASSAAGALSNAAGQVKNGQPAVQAPVAQPAAIDTREKLDAWFKTLPPTQTTFTGTDGKVRIIPGRSSQTSAQPAAAAPAVVTPAATAPAGTITYDAATGELKQQPAANPAEPAMVADGTVVKPQAAATVDIPTLLEGPLPPKGARTEEQKVAAAARLQDFMENSIKTGLWILTGPVEAVRLVKRTAGEFIQAVKKLSPTEEERAVTGFRNVLKQGTFRANEDTVVMLNNFLASKQGTEPENAKAQKMLKVIADKLGVDTSAMDKSGSGGGEGAIVDKPWGVNPHTDAMSPAARARYKEATGEDINGSSGVMPASDPGGYKTGTDDKRGSVDPEQERQLRNLLKGRGFSASQIDAEVAKLRKR